MHYRRHLQPALKADPAVHPVGIDFEASSLHDELNSLRPTRPIREDDVDHFLGGSLVPLTSVYWSGKEPHHDSQVLLSMWIMRIDSRREQLPCHWVRNMRQEDGELHQASAVKYLHDHIGTQLYCTQYICMDSSRSDHCPSGPLTKSATVSGPAGPSLGASYRLSSSPSPFLPGGSEGWSKSEVRYGRHTRALYPGAYETINLVYGKQYPVPEKRGRTRIPSFACHLFMG